MSNYENCIRILLHRVRENDVWILPEIKRWREKTKCNIYNIKFWYFSWMDIWDDLETKYLNLYIAYVEHITGPWYKILCQLCQLKIILEDESCGSVFRNINPQIHDDVKSINYFNEIFDGLQKWSQWRTDSKT